MSEQQENGGNDANACNVSIRTFFGQVFSLPGNSSTTIRDVKLSCELKCAVPSDLQIIKHDQTILGNSTRVVEKLGEESNGSSRVVSLELIVPSWWIKLVQACIKGETRQVLTRIKLKMNQLTTEERAFAASFIAAGHGNHVLLGELLSGRHSWKVDIAKRVLLSGRTILHSAVSGRSISCIVSIMMANNSFVLLSQLDQNNESPIQLAMRLDNGEGVLQLLDKYRELRKWEIEAEHDNDNPDDLHETLKGSKQNEGGLKCSRMEITDEDREGQSPRVSCSVKDAEIDGKETATGGSSSRVELAHNTESGSEELVSKGIDNVKQTSSISNESSLTETDNQVSKEKDRITSCNDDTQERLNGELLCKVSSDEESTNSDDSLATNALVTTQEFVKNRDLDESGAGLRRGRLKLRMPPREFLSEHVRPVRPSKESSSDLAVPVISINDDTAGGAEDILNGENNSEDNLNNRLSPDSVEIPLDIAPVPHPPVSPPTLRSSRWRPIRGSLNNASAPVRGVYRTRSASPPEKRTNVVRSGAPNISPSTSYHNERITRRPASSHAELSRSRSLSPNRLSRSPPRMTSRSRAPISPLATGDVSKSSPQSPKSSPQSPKVAPTSPRFGRRIVAHEDGGNYFTRERSQSAILPNRPDYKMVYGDTDESPQEAQGAVLTIPLYMGLRRGSLPIQSLSEPTSPQLSRKRHSLRENSDAHKRLIDLKLEVSTERRDSLPWNKWKTIKTLVPLVAPAHAQPEVTTNTRMRRKSFDLWLLDKEKDNYQKQLEELAAEHEKEKSKEEKLRKLSRTAKTYEEWLEEKERENLTECFSELEQRIKGKNISAKSKNALKFEEWLRKKDEEALMREEKMRKEAEKLYEDKRKRREEERTTARTFRKVAGKLSTL